MRQPDTHIPPPVRPRIAETLRALKKGESYLFDFTTPGAVQSVVTRVKQEFNGKRQFTTKLDEATGYVRVWRLQ